MKKETAKKPKESNKQATKETKAWCGTTISSELYEKLKSFLRERSYKLNREYTMREWLESKIKNDV